MCVHRGLLPAKIHFLTVCGYLYSAGHVSRLQLIFGCTISEDDVTIFIYDLFFLRVIIIIITA